MRTMVDAAHNSRDGSRRSADIRDEALLATPHGPQPVRLHAWRGRSGRRYVVSVYPLAAGSEAACVEDAVLIAVRVEADGSRRLIGLKETGLFAADGYDSAWFGLMRDLGANELHIHLIALSHEEREAVMRDLGQA